MALASLAYPIFRSATIGHLFFGFPELILCVMSGLVLVGGYTGYRLSELWRFRSMRSPTLATIAAGIAPPNTAGMPSQSAQEERAGASPAMPESYSGPT